MTTDRADDHLPEMQGGEQVHRVACETAGTRESQSGDGGGAYPARHHLPDFR